MYCTSFGYYSLENVEIQEFFCHSNFYVKSILDGIFVASKTVFLKFLEDAMYED